MSPQERNSNCRRVTAFTGQCWQLLFVQYWLVFLLLSFDHSTLQVYASSSSSPLSSLIADPILPLNLNITVLSGKSVNLTWDPPADSSPNLTYYKLNVISLSDRGEPKLRKVQVLPSLNPQVTLTDLYPGGNYELQLHAFTSNGSINASAFNTFTIDTNSTVSPFESGSKRFLTANFTTKPNTPGRFIVWFRNETTLLVLWQPPYPAGIFDQYKVSIEPQDAFHSVLYVLKESDPPGPAQAAFYGLVPGREYTITVQTLSGEQISKPTVALYRTVPLAPSNITADLDTLGTNTLTVSWQPPRSLTEFDRYQVALNLGNTTPRIVSKSDPRKVRFSEHLEPGHTYEIVVKTLSGNVASWPVLRNITTRPLPVHNLVSHLTSRNEIELKWIPSNDSVQDAYLIRYHELDAFNSDGTMQVVKDTRVLLRHLLDGRNYSIAVYATSNGIQSAESITYQATKPASPVIEVLESVADRSLNVSWKSDVTSRQDEYHVFWSRMDQPGRQETHTRNHWLLLENLHPGATYTINVSAISYGLRSEPHTYVQTLYPRPPEALQVVKVNNSTVILTWQSPTDSLIDAYVLRYRPVSSTLWRELGTFNVTSNEIRDLVAGEKYVFRVNTVSNKVESPEARELEQTLYPNPIESVNHVIGSSNVTFKLVTPLGRIDYYIIVYAIVGQPSSQSSKQVPAGDRTHLGDPILANIEQLQPGELYTFRLYAVSHNLRSEGISLMLRTRPLINSVINIVTYEQETKTLGIKFTPTPRRSSVFDRYRFQLTSDPSIPAQEKLANDTHRLVLFDNLVPGRLYNLSIWTVSGGVYSTPIIRETRLFPEPVRQLSAQQVTHCEITLSWNPPNGQFDGYEITYLHPHQPNRLIRNFTQEARFAYRDLRPHQNYTFEVLTVAGRGSSTMLRSSPVSRTFTTLESTPGRLMYFRPLQVKPNQITFEWLLPTSVQNGVLTGFKITFYQRINSATNVNEESLISANVGSSSLNALVNSLSGTVSEPVQSGNSGGAQVLPLSANSTNLSALVAQQPVNYQLFDAAATQGTIGGLQSGAQYVFAIQAYTRVGAGPKTHWEQEMPIWPPPKPSTQATAVPAGRSSSTLKVRFRRSFFSNAHGPILHYAVIVAEQPQSLSPSSLLSPSVTVGDELPLQLPSWSEIQSLSNWPAYQAAELFNPFDGGQSVAEFTVGSDVHCSRHTVIPPISPNLQEPAPINRVDNGISINNGNAIVASNPSSETTINSSRRYCNGPLRAGRTYLVKIRAFTSPTKYTDTLYSEPMTTEPDSGAILWALFLPLSLFILLGALLILLRQRRLRPLSSLTGNKPTNNISNNLFTKPRHENGLLTPGLHLSSALGAKSNLDVAGQPYAVLTEAELITSKNIKLINFGEHFRLMSADSDFRFSEEFEMLRNVGRERQCSAADLPVNRPKNRFTNILPFDHSRVKLQPTDDEEGSDYINANYIPGSGGPREYIVTQGPLHSTRDDFWRMCWEQNCKAIVMLTRCVEKGREKCDHYWPYNTQPVIYGDIQVTLLNESQYANWTISEFRVARAEQQRIVRHFHFTTWPDFGVPEPPHILVRFVRTFRERVSLDPNRPVVVHCSAGVGRSGTFIALDRVLNELSHKDSVNIFRMVYEMRKDRVCMVQNEQQYICIHQCLMTVLDGNKQDLLIEPLHPQVHENQSYEDDEGIAESGI